MATNNNKGLNKIEKSMIDPDFIAEVDQVSQQLADKANDAEVRKKSIPIGLNDADSDMLAAIQGGEGASFSLLSVPRDYSVDPIKTTFVKTGKNLFSKEAANIGVTLASNGTTSTKADEYTSAYIPVEPNTQYIRVRSGYRIAFYDANRAFISVTTANPFTTPSGCAYVRISGPLSAIDNEQVEKGGVNTGYEPFYLDVKNMRLNENVRALEYEAAELKSRVERSEKGIRALKRNPISPEVGEMWLYVPTVNLFKNGGFEAGNLSEWGTTVVGNPVRDTGVSSVAGDYVEADGQYGYKVALTSYPDGTTGHSIYQALRSTDGDLNKLSDFSLRFKPVSAETSQQDPKADSNAVFVRLQVNAYDVVSGGSIINDVANHRSNIYLFGARQYTNATHKQEDVRMDEWTTITADLKAFISERLLAGYTWNNVNRVELTVYTYAAASAGTNRISVRFDTFMAVGE